MGSTSKNVDLLKAQVLCSGDHARSHCYSSTETGQSSQKCETCIEATVRQLAIGKQLLHVPRAQLPAVVVRADQVASAALGSSRRVSGWPRHGRRWSQRCPVLGHVVWQLAGLSDVGCVGKPGSCFGGRDGWDFTGGPKPLQHGL